MPRKLWTEEEMNYLREKYPDNKCIDIANFLKRSIVSVYGMASIMKLAKSETFKNSEASGIIKKGSKIGQSNRFTKGNISWNTGKKMQPGWGGNTRFKKGNIPHNTKRDGEIVTRKDKNEWSYKYIRISVSKWELLHRYNYKKCIGAIPADSMVCFKDGNSLNCEPSNLKLETKKEHMARNTIMRFPPELISTIKLLGKYKRKIKAYEKQD